MRFKDRLSRSVPALGTAKRFAIAARDTVGRKTSYSQHGEDIRAAELLAGFHLDAGMYIDVGANHPTDISNTYAFYRAGLSGLIIEPNPELSRLFTIFRPRDITLTVACSDAPGVATFTISKTPVLSSLDPAAAGPIWKQIRVPLLPLDLVVRDLKPSWIPLLSVDVEGHSGSVLKGAKNMLAITYLLCVEASEGTDEERDVLEQIDSAGFEIVERRGCNLFAVNRRTEHFAQYRR